MLKFPYKQDSLQRFFDMLRSVDDLCVIGMNSRERDEIRKEDLLFVDRSRTDYDGNICTVSVADYDDGKVFFERVYISGNEVTLCCPTDGDIWRVCPLDAVKITGIVTGLYRPLQAKERADITGFNGLFDNIRKTDPGAYFIKLKEIEAINTRNKGGLYSNAFDYFRYGFLKGQRAAKRKKAVSAAS